MNVTTKELKEAYADALYDWRFEQKQKDACESLVKQYHIRVTAIKRWIDQREEKLNTVKK
jgi:hypothetical protein